jgi:4-amino-4-deoxy-L-arabinose transferase-like glycosyltransferase
LLVLGGVALAVRLVHLQVAGAAGLFPGLFLDSRFYEFTARAIRAGLGAGDHPYLLSPLYPYLLAPFVGAEGGLNAGAVRILQAIAGAATCVLVGDIGSRVAGRRVGLVAGVAAALYGPSIYFDSRILVAGYQAFFLTAGLWFLVVYDAGVGSRRQRLAVLGAGVALGFSAALRPTGLAILAALIVVPWIVALVRRALGERWKLLLVRSILLLSGAVLVVLPFAVRNLVVGGEHVLLSANGGINFWIGNHAGADGVFHAPPDYDPINDPLHVRVAEEQTGRDLSYRDAGAWWRDRAVDDIRSDPLRWTRLTLRKLALFTHPKEIPQLGSSFAWHEQRAWTLRFPLDARHLLILALLTPLAVGLRGGIERVRALRWVLLAAATHVLVVALFFVTGRYRAPIAPLLIVLATAGVVTVLEGLRGTERRPMLAVAAAAVLLTLVSFPIFARGGPLHFADVFPGEERHLGMTLMAEGRHEEAVAAFRRSLAYREMSQTRTNLAIALKNLKRYEDAAREYEKALAANPRDGIAWYNYGNLKREHLHDREGAALCFREAVRYRPLLAEAHFNLGLTMLELGRADHAVGPLARGLELASATDTWADGAREALELAQGSLKQSP